MVSFQLHSERMLAAASIILGCGWYSLLSVLLCVGVFIFFLLVRPTNSGTGIQNRIFRHLLVIFLPGTFNKYPLLSQRSIFGLFERNLVVLADFAHSKFLTDGYSPCFDFITRFWLEKKWNLAVCFVFFTRFRLRKKRNRTSWPELAIRWDFEPVFGSKRSEDTGSRFWLSANFMSRTKFVIFGERFMKLRLFFPEVCRFSIQIWAFGSDHARPWCGRHGAMTFLLCESKQYIYYQVTLTKPQFWQASGMNACQLSPGSRV